MLRHAIRGIVSSVPAEWILSALEHVDAGRSHVLPVLTYHRILDPATRPGLHAGLCVSPAVFECHLDTLSRRYEVISLADVLEARRGEAKLPRRALLLTFDDAYGDFEENAWPILRSRSLQATLFVPTWYPDHPDRWFWWDRLSDLLVTSSSRGRVSTPVGELAVGTARDRQRAFQLLRDHFRRVGVAESMAILEQLAADLGGPPTRNEVLGWASLRRLASDGVTLAPHSRTHPMLPSLDDAQLRDELIGSREDLEREIGACAPSFAYPSGAHDQRVVAAAADAGYEIAFTTRRGVNDLRHGQWLELRRINVGQRTSATMLRAQAGSWMTIGNHL